jgi:hypothetical protein
MTKPIDLLPCREAFEKWAVSTEYGSYLVRRAADGKYESSHTQIMWMAWQAAWNAAKLPDGWQDISTAPKDGTLIIVRGYIDRLATGPCNREYFYVAEYHQQYNRFISPDGTEIGHAYLTHWMPLPNPPVNNKHKEG